MPTPPLSDELALEAARIYAEHGLTKGAKVAGLNANAFNRRVQRAVERGFIVRQGPKPAARSFEVAKPPQDDLSIDELLELKRKVFARQRAKDQFANLIPVTIKVPGPVVLGVYGDPHIDDDGTDMPTLEKDLDAITGRDWAFGINLGDLTNNWIGRLARKYADQMITRRQAGMLVEWMLRADRNWLAVIKGNHDLWQGDEVISWALRGSGAIDQAHGVRLELRFPKGGAIRVHARHDFPGNSMWNGAHALRRELAFGFRDHIVLAGHRHTDAYSMVPNPAEGFASHLVRVSGYKVIDDFAEERRFLSYRMNPSAWFLIQPEHPVQAERIKLYHDAAEALDVCAYKRKKAKV
jgi:hypothetical protein